MNIESLKKDVVYVCEYAGYIFQCREDGTNKYSHRIASDGYYFAGRAHGYTVMREATKEEARWFLNIIINARENDILETFKEYKARENSPKPTYEIY